MREILFRGKRVDNGEWVYGFLLFDAEQNEAYIVEYFEDKAAYLKKVIPETVGQYIGSKGSKRTKQYPEGQMIFEGDILKTKWGVGYVIYEHDCFCLQYLDRNKPSVEIVMRLGDVFVIGNICDNPQMLKRRCERCVRG